MFETFTVPQEHGGDSVVEVSESVREGYPAPVRLLHFYTSQSLTTQSGRAWNVNEAIGKYARKRGYEIESIDSHAVTARYDSRIHSLQAWQELKQQIESNPRYIEALAAAKQDTSQVQAIYGPVISQVKNLLHALEKRASAELCEIQNCHAVFQRMILEGLVLPDHLTDLDRESLERSFYRPEFDHYRRYGDGLPDDLDTILALLD